MTEILQDCNRAPKLHERLESLCENAWGRCRAFLAKSPQGMRSPFRLDDEVYVETHYDTLSMLNVLKHKILDTVGYDYSGIKVKVWDPLQNNSLQNLKDSSAREQLPDSLENEPRVSLSQPSAWFKGKRPISVCFADGREVAAPTWRSVIAEILKDCNRDENMHHRLKNLCDNVWGKSRAILASSPLQMNKPCQIDDNLYVETYYDTQELLTVLKDRILDVVGYDYKNVRIKVRDPIQEKSLGIREKEPAKHPAVKETAPESDAIEEEEISGSPTLNL